MRFPVFKKNAYSWPSEIAKEVPYHDLPDLLTRRFDDEEYFLTGYSATQPYRLNKRAAGRPDCSIAMYLLLVDVDAPEKNVTPEWQATESDKIAALLSKHPNAYVYTTLGGYRLVYKLAEPFPINSLHDGDRWKAHYNEWCTYLLTQYGIKADTNCSDWTRLIRVPHTKRNVTAGYTPATFGDPSDIGRWDCPVTIKEPEYKTLRSIDDDHEWPPAEPALLTYVRERVKEIGPSIEFHGGEKKLFLACATVVNDYALSDGEACEIINEWNQTCQPPWSKDDLRKKLDNAYNRGVHGAKRLDWIVLDAYLTQGDELRRYVAALEPTITVTETKSALEAFECTSNELPASESIGPLDTYPACMQWAAQRITEYTGKSKDPTTDRPFFESAKTLFAGADTPPKWLIKSLIMEGGTAIIGGEAKSAKSWLATELSIALATGTNAFNDPRFTCTPRPVAYFYTEDMRDSIRVHVRALLASRGLTPTALDRKFYAEPRGHRIDLVTQLDCAKLIASVKLLEKDAGEPIGMVTLDPLRNVHSGQEDKADSMAAVFANVQMIEAILKTTVVIPHHTGKYSETTTKRRGGQKLRGSSAVHGFVDSALYLSDSAKNDDETILTSQVESEVKAARGAGKFELTLHITDDPKSHTATLARWCIAGKGSTVATAEKVETWEATAKAIVDAMYGQSLRKGKTDNRTIDGIVKGARAALQNGRTLAKQKGWLRQDEDDVWLLTSEGEALAHRRATKTGLTNGAGNKTHNQGIALGTANQQESHNAAIDR